MDEFSCSKNSESGMSEDKTDRRLLGFDVGDRSILFVGVSLVGLIVLLVFARSHRTALSCFAARK